MCVESFVARPLLDKSEIGRICIVLDELVDDAAVLGTGRFDQCHQQLACLGDRIRFRDNMCNYSDSHFLSWPQRGAMEN
jgi:hypothetical protein